MDSLGEEVDGRDPPAWKKRALRILARDEPAPLELPQEPELTGF